MLVDQKIKLIGDPHIGLPFDKGVPLNRRGERELMQLEDFAKALDHDVLYNIMVGDLFDKPLVDLRKVHEVYDLYEEASKAHPNCLFILQAGNHDLFRQLRDPHTGKPLRGSFHALAKMLQHLPNVEVVFTPKHFGDLVVFPWQWGVTALEQVEQFEKLPPIAVGHWDLMDFGGSTDHMCPVNALVTRGVTKIFSGHMHTPGDYVVDKIAVTCTGSLQPYTHGEDPDKTLYITLTLDELDSINPDDLRYKNVRLILKSGESLPEVDCLSLISKREAETDELHLEHISMDGVDINVALEQEMELEGVSEQVREFIREKLNATT